MICEARHDFFSTDSDFPLVSVVICPKLYAKDAHNGYWWRGSSDGFKIGYVIGFVEGSSSASDTYLEWLSQFKKDKSFPVEMASKLTNYDQIRFGQIIAGLDEFYTKISENMNIHVEDVIPFVRFQIRGRSDTELSSQLERLRKNVSTAGYDD